jgi:hypothetical protein
MTLVVGRVDSDIGFLVADTLLTFDYDLRGIRRLINNESHALKIQILNPDTAIAFAGDAAKALGLIRTLHAELKEDPTTRVSERLFELSTQLHDYKRRTLADFEFLVLQLTQEGRKLAHVTSEAFRYCERAYIGDQAEYQRMLELRRPYCSPKTRHVQQPDGTFREEPLVESEGQIEFTELSVALEDLTRLRRRESTVGAISGCVTRVCDAWPSRKLEYLQSGEASTSPWEGKSGFTVLASNTDVRGIGIYYRSGQMGFLFIVGDCQYCRRIDAETLGIFIEMAKTTYELDLTGVGFNC